MNNPTILTKSCVWVCLGLLISTNVTACATSDQAKKTLPVPQQPTIDTPLELLTELRARVDAKDWQAVRSLVFDVPFQGKSLADQAVVAIQGSQSSKLGSSDFRYDAEAIDHIIKNHMDAFAIADENAHREIMEDLKPLGVRKKREDFIFFQKGNAVMVLIKDNGALKFLLWEDLDSILPDAILKERYRKKLQSQSPNDKE